MFQTNSKFYHKELNRVCRLVQQGKSCLVKGYYGSGKSTFLSHVEEYFRELSENDERYNLPVMVDFKHKLSLLPQAATLEKDELVKKLQENASADNRITVYLFDHVDEIKDKKGIYDASFFNELCTYKGRQNIIYVFACIKSLQDILKRVSEQEIFKDLVDLEEIPLGRIADEEAKQFIRSELVRINTDVITTITRVAGYYPLFLVAAVEVCKELFSLDEKEGEISEEELEKALVRKEAKSYQVIWDSLDEKDREILHLLSTGRAIPKESLDRLDAYLCVSHLVIGRKPTIFSTAFARFVREQTGKEPRKQRGGFWRNLWHWNRARTLVAMLVLFFLYSIIVPILVLLHVEPFIVQGVIIGFLAFFAALGFLYIVQVLSRKA